MIQSSAANFERALSLGFEGARPRAATVSMCRYIPPNSPLTKPSASPPNSPPSLILPPPGHGGFALMRSLSRLSSVDDRLVCSAPSSSMILSHGSDYVDNTQCGMNARPNDSSALEFTLLEEKDHGSTPHELSTPTMSIPLNVTFVGMDDLADASPTDAHNSEEFTGASFGASPVLLSCLREISRMSNPNIN